MLKQVAFNAKNIATAHNAASELKHVIQVYFADNGELPSSLAQLNMADNWTPSATVNLHKNGVFTVVLDNTYTKGSLVFTPTIHQDSYLDWTCITPDIKGIGRYIPTCLYKSD